MTSWGRTGGIHQAIYARLLSGRPLALGRGARLVGCGGIRCRGSYRPWPYALLPRGLLSCRPSSCVGGLEWEGRTGTLQPDRRLSTCCLPGHSALPYGATKDLPTGRLASGGKRVAVAGGGGGCWAGMLMLDARRVKCCAGVEAGGAASISGCFDSRTVISLRGSLTGAKLRKLAVVRLQEVARTAYGGRRGWPPAAGVGCMKAVGHLAPFGGLHIKKGTCPRARP